MKKRIISIVMLIALISSLVLVSSCGKKEEEVVKIGAILPLTGNLAFLGNSLKVGLLVAQDEINKENKKTDVIFEDSKGESKTGLSVAQKLLTVDKVDGIIVFLDAVIEPIIPLIQGKKLPQINLTMNPLMSDKSDCSFTIFPTSKSEVPPMLEIIKNKQPNKIACLYNMNTPGHVFAIESKLLPELREMVYSTKDLLIETVDITKDKNFRNQMSKISAFNPDLLIVFMMPPFINQFYKDFHTLGLEKKCQILGNMGFVAAPSVSNDLTEGTIFTLPPFYITKSENILNFANKCEEKLGSPPSLIEASFGYDALKILTKALTQSTTHEEAINYIAKLKGYEGITGPIETKGSNANIEMRLVIIKNGKFEQYETK